MRRRDPKLARTAARAAETARQARLKAVVREHGTESEQVQLMLSTLITGRVTLTELAAAADGEAPIELGLPDPELLARLTRRAERRAKLKLPKVTCAADPRAPACRCLERALDQPDAGGKRQVRAIAKAFHRRKTVEPPRPTPVPQDVPAEPQEANGHVEDPLPPPVPEPEQKPRPRPHRVVHRTPQWYDPTPQSFRDMTF